MFAWIDSVAALVPSRNSKVKWVGFAYGPAGAAHVASYAQAHRHCFKNRILVWFHHQIREKIGVMFGNPEPPRAAAHWKFYASVRADVPSVAPSRMVMNLPESAPR